MKQLGALVILISIVGVAAFGFVLLQHADGMHAGTCVSILTQGAPCAEFGALAGAIFHVEILKKLSTTTLTSIIIGLLFLIALFAVRPGVAATTLKPQLAARHFNSWQNSPNQSVQQRAIRAWLAKHENSPARA